MAIKQEDYFSGQNAQILIDEVEVGYLQNVTIDESFNMIEVDGVGSQTTVDFIPGIFKGRVTAQKGLLEINYIIDLLSPYVPDKAVISSLLSSFSGNKGNIQNILQTIGTGISAANKINNFLNQSDIDNSVNVMSFDIKIKNGDKVFCVLKDCVIDSRNITISTGNVVIMNNITIKYKKNIKYI